MKEVNNERHFFIYLKIKHFLHKTLVIRAKKTYISYFCSKPFRAGPRYVVAGGGGGGGGALKAEVLNRVAKAGPRGGSLRGG